MKILFVSLGCDKNLVDSEHMSGLLSKAGYEFTDDETQADIIIINSCCFIKDAKEESIETIFEMARYKEEGQCKALVLAGCLAQRYHEEIKTEIPEVDICIGTTAIDSIVSALDDYFKEHKKKEYLKDVDFLAAANAPRNLSTLGSYAYLKIAEGCDKHCTYCIIPKVRGNYRSVKMEYLIDEAKKLAEQGVKELILVAQETTMYGKDIYGKKSLHILLKELAKISGVYWIRILYCYPEEIYDELIDVTISDNNDNIMLITKKGQGIKFRETDVRETGRSAMGVRGIELNQDDEVISMQLESQGECVLIVSANGMGKRTPFTDFKLQNRGGKGVKCYKISDKTGEVVGAKAVNDGNEIMMITNEGIVIRMFVDDISILGRVTLGVKLMNTGDKDDIVVASITKVKESVTEADALEAARLSEENETLAEGSEELSEDSDSEDN